MEANEENERKKEWRVQENEKKYQKIKQIMNSSSTVQQQQQQRIFLYILLLIIPMFSWLF